MPQNNQITDAEALATEVVHLESLLFAARTRLSTLSPPPSTVSQPPPPPPPPHPPPNPIPTPSHALLLLSDSALPLGSFAFSSGLESYLAHQPSPSSFSSSPLPKTALPNHPPHPHSPPPHFLALSLHALTTQTLPYLLRAHARPRLLRQLDAALDASTLCPVTRRASVAQGRALLTLWERAFRGGSTGGRAGDGGETGRGGGRRDKEASLALEEFSRALRSLSSPSSFFPSPEIGEAGRRRKDEEEVEEEVHFASLGSANGHFPPLWGALTRCLGLGAREAAYVFLLNHAKAVLSAGVRAGRWGGYQAQAWLGGEWLGGEIGRVVAGLGKVEGEGEEEDDEDEDKGETEEGGGLGKGVEEAGQGVPAMDLWVGRHEVLYSRIFNS